MVIFHFPDNRYPAKPFTHIRPIARAVVLDKEGKVYLHHIHRNDMFGDATYYETPGGGVDEGETFEQAVVRECEEELGLIVEVIAPIAEVQDAYHLIGRKNVNRFFLCREVGSSHIHHESSGDDLIESTSTYGIDEAIALYENQDSNGVPGLVKQRELPILYLAKDRLSR